MSGVEWRAIPEWEGIYEASTDGRVRTLDRTSSRRRFIQGRELIPTVNKYGYATVGLRKDKRRVNTTVHKAVMAAFIGPRPENQEVRHLDGNPTNNSLANLAYGTRRENNLDAVRHGTNLNAAKTHCKWGHEFTEANTYRQGTSRKCRKCRSVTRIRRKKGKSEA